MAALIAGLPIEVGGATVNRNCGSSIQAINQAAQSIAAGCEDVQLAGGVEHMHHIPMESGFDPSPRFFYRYSQATLNMGLTAENLALKYRISRKEQDEFALRSHRQAAAATDSGAFAREVVPTWGRDAQGRKQIVTEDECIRRDSSLEALAIGHPLGASGARIATTLIHAMQDRKAQFGLATMCIGAGQGIATIFEAL